MTEFERLLNLVSGPWILHIGSPFPGDTFRRLYRCNKECCRVNMEAIAERKYAVPRTEVIAECERTARRVGEQRVQAKAEINAALSAQLKGTGEPWPWDIVMSVGDLLDRITIESVKCQVFGAGKQADAKRLISQRLADAAFACYMEALKRAREQGFYYAQAEARTYA